MVNLKEYPVIGAEIETWKEGIKIARELARSVGMRPAIQVPNEDRFDDDDNNNDGRNVSHEDYWFYRPFECLGNSFRSDQDNEDEDSNCTPTAGDEDDISTGGPAISGKATIYQY